jgi:MFS family permease
MTLHANIHYINFSRKLTVTSMLFLMPLYFLKIGFNGWQIGTIISFWALAPLLVSFPTGWINDRIAIAGVIRGGLIVQCFLFVLLAYAKDFFLMAAAFLLLGMANNALDVSFNSLYYKDAKAMDQNRKYGIYGFWISLGPAVGVVGGGLLTRFADFRVLQLVFAAITLLVLLTAGRFDHEKFHLVSFGDYRRNLFQAKTLLFIVFVFVLAMHWSVEGTVYSPFLEKAFGLNSLQVSYYISTGLFFLSFASLLVGFLKFNLRTNKRLLVLAMFASGAGLVLMVNANVYVSLAFRVVHEIGDGAMAALLTLFTSRLFEKRTIGGSAGLISAIALLGQMAGAMIFSPLGYRYGLQYPFLISGGLLVLNAGYGALIFRRLEY